MNMSGEILDPACSISMENDDQTVLVGASSLADIIKTGNSTSQSFSITAKDCALKKDLLKSSSEKIFYVIFDGESEGDGELFNVWGDASGVALQFSDSAGNIAKPGIPLPLTGVNSYNNRFDYKIKLVANNQALNPGHYFSAVRFKLDYF